MFSINGKSFIYLLENQQPVHCATVRSNGVYSVGDAADYKVPSPGGAHSAQH